MVLQCKYMRATEGWELEQQLNEFLSKLPRESLVSVKFVEQQTAGEPAVHFTAALVIYEA